MPWKSPLDKKNVGSTDDSMSFQNIDIATEYEVPCGDHVGAFGKARRYDIHKGVDLYANIDDVVFAVEDGVVCKIRPFTGIKAGCPWWLDTDAVNIAGNSGIVIYGEIEVNPNLCLGTEVRAGDLIGRVKRVLIEDKGRPTTMLHLALHKHGVQSNETWRLGNEQPKGLLDPTSCLIF